MKKLTSILLVVVILASLISFSSCGDKETETESPQYTTVELTKENYQKYIVFNFYCTDLDVTELSNGKYDISCVIHIESGTKNADYRFENVSIQLSKVHKGLSLNYFVSKVRLNLDAYGNAHGSSQHYSLNSLSRTVNVNDEWDMEVKSITGNVLIPVE